LQLGCELAQGYSIARPMPVEELPGWIVNWRPYPAWGKQHRISRNDLSLLFAIIEHRAWIRAIEEYIKYEREEPPPLKLTECRFGHWLDGEGKARHGAKAIFQTIALLHNQVHTIGDKLGDLQAKGRQEEALAGLGDLNELRDALLKLLSELLSESRGQT
jgi:hypothetical protein